MFFSFPKPWLWHYTNNHKGFCVEYSDDLFDFLGSVEGFLAYSKVEYSDFPPSVDSLENESSIIKKIMFNTQSEWKYEQEHRVVILSKKDIDFIPIDHKYVKAVYIGAKAEIDLESRIIELCSSNDIDVYYGITLGKTYEVTFKKHKEGTYYSRSFWE